MARTVNPVAHAARRDTFVDAAIRLIRRKGYAQLSVQDVIDDVGASKGAFFHYFDSKAALLAAVVDRTVEGATAVVAPVAADRQLTPLQKLEGVFAGIAQWKSAQPEYQPAAVEELVRTSYSDENAVVLARMRAAVATRLTPLLAEILREGASDGSFTLAQPEATASVITSLVLGLNDQAVRLFLARRDGTPSFEAVTATLRAYFDAFERILGLPPRSWPVLDDRILRFWFDAGRTGDIT